MKATAWFKDFDKWNKRKKLIDSLKLKENFWFKEREIWWCALGVNIGYEQDGKNNNFERPVLILKVFNKEVLFIAPLTTREKDGKYYYNFKYDNEISSVILSQVRLISSKRLLRKIKTLNNNDFIKIKERILCILK